MEYIDESNGLDQMLKFAQKKSKDTKQQQKNMELEKSETEFY